MPSSDSCAENRISTTAPTGLPVRHVIAVALGNAIEFYDFVTYAFFTAQIGRAFFPSDTPGASLLASLATFGAGFLTRPLGAFVLGRLGDRIGRKPAMISGQDSLRRYRGCRPVRRHLRPFGRLDHPAYFAQ
ncbi:MAG TPA: MFS transporter [Steroidobacteraceae bacterium]